MVEQSSVIDLPPGFRFHPTDEEILSHYLAMKVMDEKLTTIAIGEIDLNKCEPWDLPRKGKKMGGGKEWYFFNKRDRKYPTRTNRATSRGYWKATGKDREIYNNNNNNNNNNKKKNIVLGMKKTLVFYLGRAPKGEKTNWVMHEYRLLLQGLNPTNFPEGAKNEWVVCKIFHKDIASTSSSRNDPLYYADQELASNKNYQYSNILPPIPLMEDNNNNNMTAGQQYSSDQQEEEEFKAAKSTAAEEEDAAAISYFSNSCYNYNNQLPSDTIFLDYQTPQYQYSCPAVSVAANVDEQCCKAEELSSNNNNSMINVSSSQKNTEISSLLSNMPDFEYFWDY